MTDQVNIANLPPTQYLVLEVLAARARTGEHLWTFPSNLGPALHALENVGLISTMHGVAPASIRARLTETGRAYTLKSNYVTPVDDIYDAAFDKIDRHLGEYRGSKVLREGVQAAVDGARARLAQTTSGSTPSGGGVR